MSLRVVTPATLWPVSLDEAKKRLGILHSDDDTVVKGLIASATAAVEAATQRRLMRQALEWVLPCWPGRVLRLPVAGPIEISSVQFADAGGGAVTLPDAAYTVSPSGETVCLRPAASSTWPALSRDAAKPLVIAFQIGAAKVSDAPPEAATAVLFMVEYLRDPSAPGWKLAPSGLPDSVELLVEPLRWE